MQLLIWYLLLQSPGLDTHRRPDDTTTPFRNQLKSIRSRSYLTFLKNLGDDQSSNSAAMISIEWTIDCVCVCYIHLPLAFNAHQHHHPTFL